MLPPRRFSFILDSGTTLVISTRKQYVVGPIVPFKTKRILGGTEGAINIAGMCSIK